MVAHTLLSCDITNSHHPFDGSENFEIKCKRANEKNWIETALLLNTLILHFGSWTLLTRGVLLASLHDNCRSGTMQLILSCTETSVKKTSALLLLLFSCQNWLKFTSNIPLHFVLLPCLSFYLVLLSSLSSNKMDSILSLFEVVCNKWVQNRGQVLRCLNKVGFYSSGR